ncbi:hypothetical protein [Burkholderia cenocepacia]|uniref:hypothetical protein n=1 Tax=Burkholderia cenocepacia TaxID=95486 RepID=UPI002230F58C|nr:hypothetical protein [Burkholderia cenocepacia]MCW3641430.1 hypothetical protein [Burkholderia cenocepacia]
MTINTETVLKLAGLASLPAPEFRTAPSDNGLAYAWRCDALGVIAYGNSQDEAQAKWVEAYAEERRAGLLAAARHWREEADRSPLEPFKRLCRATAATLEMQAEDGIARCACCFRPFSDRSKH